MTICLKQRFPFRVATTSFIHPAGYDVNVRRLAPLVDEVELLFLQRDHLPSADEINELADLGNSLDIGYNVHLPMDISMADPSATIRSQSRDHICKALDLVAPLNASTHTLHVTFRQADHHPDTVKGWQECAVESLSLLLERCPESTSRLLSLETLDFPPEWLDPVVTRLDLPVCLDAGHIIRFGFDLNKALSLFAHRIAIFHLHGVTGDHDHRALSRLPLESSRLIASALRGFQGSVSIEVFSYQELMDSIDCFNDMLSMI